MKFIETKNYSLVRRQLQKTVQNNGWLVVSGNVGSGKTFIKRHLLDWYESRKSQYRVVELVCMDSIKINTIIRTMIRELTTEGPHRDSDAMLRQFRRVLGDISGNHRIILCIDEAQDLSFDTVRGLKKIHEITYGTREHLFSIMLIGKPEIEKHLLGEEIGLRVDHVVMKNLTLNEIAEFTGEYSFTEAAFERFVSMVNHTPLSITRMSALLNQVILNTGQKSITVKAIEHTFGKTLKELFDESGMSQRQLAKEAGISSTAVNQIVNGTYKGKKEHSDILKSILVSKNINAVKTPGQIAQAR